ncbi:MAG: hypothetical protein NZ890_18430, partial [Myxococcota bacterium]|nr:hypothetical protein [Myxococcota bacterium]
GPMVAFATDGDTQDLVAAADAVLAKAGYSTIAEAALAGVPLLAVPVVGNDESQALALDVVRWGLGAMLADEERARQALRAPAEAIALARKQASGPRPPPAASGIVDLLIEEGLLAG